MQMLQAARLSAVIEILDLVFNETRPADGIISHYFRERRYIGSKDRSFIAAESYRIMRCRMRLNWWCDRHKIRFTGRSALLADLVLNGHQSLKDIETLFGGDRFAPAPLSKPEKEFCMALKGQELNAPDMPEPVRFECPDWAYSLLKERFGNNFTDEMAALLEPAPLDLRVNTLKTTRDEAIQLLEAENIDVAATPLSPLGLRSDTRPALSRSKTFEDGLVEIQDEGSQLIALLCDVKPGMQVLDLCAGAGGKTLALAASMQNKGRLVACDVSEGRLRRSKERFRRAGIQNAETRVIKNENDSWLKRNEEKFDIVLVDAPCSGTGTWRRNPDMRWKELSLAALTDIQSKLLDRAAKLVKPGGRLVYATCSLLNAENDQQIEQFLQHANGFTIIPVSGICTALSGNMMKLTPAREQSDGFFAAVLEKAR